MYESLKTFELDKNFSIKMRRNEYGREVRLIDNVLKTDSLITTFRNNGKYEFISSSKRNEFVTLFKKYPSQFKNNIHKPMPFVYEITVQKQFVCFRRKVNITVFKTFNKLKHLI